MSGTMSRMILNEQFLTTEVRDGKLVYIFDKKQHAQALLHNLIIMQDNEEESPSHVVIISKEDEQFHFHAPILAALSNQLEEQLLKQDLGSATSKIVIKEFSSEAIQCLWDYAYTPSVVKLTQSNVEEVKKLAEHHGLDSLREECEVLEQEIFDEDGDGDSVEVEFEDVPEIILKRLHGLLEQGKLCTAAITGSDSLTRVPCHGAIVSAACSTFFSQLARVDSKDKLQVSDTQFQAIPSFLRYLYTAKLMVDPSTVQQLLEIAVTFNLPGMGHACCCWLEDALAADNALGIMGIAKEWQGKADNTSLATKTKDVLTLSDTLNDLYHSARSFVLKNFQSVKDADEFLDQDVETLIDFTGDNSLAVNSEDDVFYAVMRWVEFDPETRSEQLPNLLETVRLELTDIEFLEIIKEHSLLKANSACMKIIDEAIKDVIAHQNASLVIALLRCQGAKCPFTLVPKECEGAIEKHWSERASGTQRIITQALGIEKSVYCCVSFCLLFLFPFLVFHCPSVIDYKGEGIYPGEVYSEAEIYPNDFSEPLVDTPDEIFDDESFRSGKKLDMRRRENRKSLNGKNIDGTPDKRLKENRLKKPDVVKKLTFGEDELPRRKDGKPDRRFRIVKELERSKDEARNLDSNDDVPRRNDGKPDMRFKVNKKTGQGANPEPLPQGPTRKDGKPDMRFKANRLPEQCVIHCGPSKKEVKGQMEKDHVSGNENAAASNSYSGPLKKDGTPDMRFAANKRDSSKETPRSGPLKKNGTPDMRFRDSGETQTVLSGPLKKDGTPDMRYSSNKSSYNSTGTPSSYRGSASSVSSGHYGSSSSVSSSGPLKKDGTPDMRYSLNRGSYTSSSSSYGGSASSISSGYSGSSSSFTSSGPLKKDGTPDMRYSSNRGSYGSSYGSSSSSYRGSTSSYSSSRSGSSSSFTPSGPLKSDGTPDMRYAANRR